MNINSFLFNSWSDKIKPFTVLNVQQSIDTALYILSI